MTHECCMGLVLGRKPVAAADDERYLLCATGAAAVGLSFFFAAV